MYCEQHCLELEGNHNHHPRKIIVVVNELYNNWVKLLIVFEDIYAKSRANYTFWEHLIKYLEHELEDFQLEGNILTEDYTNLSLMYF